MDFEGRRIVLSGIRATGKLHLGNYLGAMRYFVELSRNETMRCMFFIANLHTITTRTNPEEIQKDLLEIVLDYVAVGINLKNAIIFAQSSTPETCELSWLLTCLTRVNELTSLPHFKEKWKQLHKHEEERDSEKEEKKSEESAPAGLLCYPILMAADILGPKAHLVPVGEDQHPHVEFTRTLARRFNRQFGELFPVPDLLEQVAVRVPGLDGAEKMGKSDANTIDLSDPPEIVQRKLKTAVTDPARKRRNDPGTPGKCNLYTLHALVSSDEELKEVAEGCRNATIGCLDCKKILGTNINSLLAPIQEKKAELEKKGPDYPFEILRHGAIVAGPKIRETVKEAKELMGVPKY